jgi:integrase
MRIKKRGVVRWREDIGKYIIDYYDNLGKRHREAIGGNEHDAYRILNKKIEEIDVGTFETSPKIEAFKPFAERWLGAKAGIKERTRISYQGILNNHLIPYFGNARIIELRRKNIQEFIREKAESGNLSSKSISNILAVLHEILEDAQVENLIVRNPYLKIEKPKKDKPEVDYLKTEEIPIFLKACEMSNYYALFYAAIFTGMRRGELLSRKWGDIDWIGRKIHVKDSLYKGEFQTPKSEYSKRAIDMGPRLIQTLKGHRTAQDRIRLKAGESWTDNDLIFCRNDGKPLDADNLYHRDFKRILRRAELRSIRIHDLRHSYAAILISVGHNFKYIQTQMGHSSIKVTMDLYGHLMPEVHEGAAKRTEDFVFCPVTGPEKEKGVTIKS